MVPLNDLKRHYESIRPQIDAAINRVMEQGHYIMGPEHDAFEKEFAGYHGRRFGIAVANGTDALELGLRSLGIRPGDEVLMVANACMYGTIATLNAQAIPVFVDVDAKTLTMSPSSLAEAISPATRVVIVTHLYGKMADVEEIQRVLKHHPHIKVLEDCSQAHGAQWKGRKAGTFSDVAAFSLYPTKNLGAFGDAGILIADAQEVQECAKKLRNYGWGERYQVETPMGRNSRLDELQAAILRVKLPYLDAWNEKRRIIAKRYAAAAVGTGIEIVHHYGEDFVAHHCVARHPERDRIREYFAHGEVASGLYYPIPDTLQPIMQGQIFRCMDLSQTYQAQKEIFTLPCFPEMTGMEIEKVCYLIGKA